MKQNKWSLYFPPLIVFIAVMVIVVGSYSVSRNAIALERQQAINDYSANLEGSIKERLLVFEENILSGAGLFVAIDDVSRADWKQYIEGTRVLERYKGLKGIGYSKVVAQQNLDSFVEQSRKTTSPDFTVFPQGNREVYAPIIYLEPLDESNKRAIGYDMFSEETRKKAMERARDSGHSAASDTVRLVQSDGDNDQLGFLFYAPQYSTGTLPETVDLRRKLIDGYVYGVFRINDFITNSIDPDMLNEDVGFRIFSTGETDERLLYETDNVEALDNSQSTKSSRNISLSGADWRFDYIYKPNSLLPQAFSQRSLTILFFGTFSATLIAGITYLLLRGKENQLELIKERETNDAKDSLLSIASHQLRTPATGVKQYVGMVLQGFVGDISQQQESMLNKAYASNERQLKTINDVLYLARIDSGRIILTKKEVDVKSLIKSLCEELQDEVETNRLKIKLNLPKKPILVSADEHMLRMSIENLLTNAIKYTKQNGKITIGLSLAGDRVKISVVDTGVGIEKDDYDKLFKQFSRLQNELSKSVSGTGIGLYLTKHLIEMHDGIVEVDSIEGKGSTFTIIIPKN